MTTPRKTKEEKIAILREAEQKGIVATCDKYGIYPATYYNWKISLNKWVNSASATE